MTTLRARTGDQVLRAGLRGLMRKLLGWVGATLGGDIGWWAGAGAGMMTAVITSAIGTGAGLYLGWWASDRLLD